MLLVVRLQLDQHLEDRGRLLEPSAREVRLDHLRVGLRDQGVVARQAVQLDELAQAPDVLRVALDDLLEEGRPAVDLAAPDAGCYRPVTIIAPTCRASRKTDAAAPPEARALGFGGKLCIHPNQVAFVNAAFRPTADEIAWAKRVVAADAAAHGAAVAGDGKMVDRPVLLRAKEILAAGK